jgi:toxin ParE1/3/4
VGARFTVRPRAWRDITEHLTYLQERGDSEVAERLLEAFQVTFSELAKMPRMGSPCFFKSQPVRALRRWPINGFENWLVFYLPKRHGVEIVRVLHGSRDLEAIWT